MANDLYLVFSKRPDQISAADYDRWYEKHSQENIESPGFVKAQRYAIDQVNGPETGSPREPKKSPTSETKDRSIDRARVTHPP